MKLLESPKTKELVCKVKEGAGTVVRKLGKRNIAIILSVLAIGGAVWLNIALFSQGLNSTPAGSEAGDQSGGSFVDGDGEDASGNLSASSADSYFASAQVERSRSRDEAIEVLQLVVENPNALDESKAVAMAEISKIAADIDNEAKIESLVMAKGFDKCIAVISDSSCNVVVKCESTLLPNQIAQIYEIVYEQSGILPANVKVIEKMA